MNRIFRSVWNEVSRTWVAAAECVKSRGKSAGGSGEDGPVAAALSGKKPRGGIQRPRPTLLALEARLMFDGAAVATGAEVMADAVHHGAPEAMAAGAERVSEAPAAPPVEHVPAAPPRVEIVFIESNVVDPQSLLDNLRPGAEVHVLDAAQDGLAQMAQILEGRSGIDAIHVLSHGSPGAIGLGSLTLTTGNLAEHGAELSAIGRALNPDADILLYGCNTGAGPEGATLIGALAQATQADVAASTNLTGATAYGGDWRLEVASGTIETDAAILGRAVTDYAFELTPNTAPTIGGAVAGQAVRDSAILYPFSGVTITDPDAGASVTVTITLDSAAKGVFTSASLAATGFSTSDGGLTYTHAAGTPAALQAAIRGLLYNPTDDRVAVGSTETTTFTISVSDGIASAVTDNTTTVVSTSVDYGQRTFGLSGSTIYVRPGDTSQTWTFSGIYDMAYYKADFNPTGLGAEDWLLTRGKFQFSTDGGTSWTDYNDTTTIPNSGPINWQTASGKTWRYVDEKPLDTTTSNNIGYGYHITNGGGSTGTGSFITVDQAPTDISSSKNYFLSGTSPGTVVATLTPTDTGDSTGGYWEIDSQSVPNLFTIAATNANTTNTARLSIGSGTIPSAGQTVTVTARYYDRFQTNNSTTPMSGEGYSKQFTFTVMDEQSADLNFGNDLKVSTTTANDQLSPAITTLSNGNFVVVWQSDGQGEATGKNGIYGQIYSATGAAVGSEFAITTAGNGIDERAPAVTALDNGRFAVAYTTTPGANGLDIGYRIVEADGTVGSQMVANTTVAGAQTSPVLTTLSGGAFVAAWETGGAIHAQKFNAADGSKNGSELTIDAAGNDVHPMLAALSNGEYVVAWGDAGAYEVKAVVSSAPSTVIDVSSGSMATANVYTDGAPQARVAGLAGGGFVVAWSSYDSSYGQTDVLFQRYNNAGVAQGSTVQANTASAVGEYKDLAAVTALSGGGFVVGWQADTGDYDQNGLFGRRYDSSGTAVDTSEFEINQHRLGDQNNVVLTAVGTDRFAAAWVDNTSDTTSAGIEARVLLPNGPTITSATYDASTGVLAVTGTNMTGGDTIDASQLTLTGEGGATYTLTTTGVTASSATAFSITLNATDKAAVNLMLNKNGTSSTSGTSFNLGGATNWDSTATAVADATNAVAVSNVAVPAITSATYDAGTGVLVVTGTGFLSKSGATNDIDITKLTLTGEGGTTYTLTSGSTASVEVTSATSFSVTLGATDRDAVNQFMNKAGTSSTGGSTYNLAAAEDWAAGAASAVTVADLTGNGVTVSNVPAPAITSATYNASTGTLVVTGTGFVSLAGSTNDIDVTKLTITGEGGSTYTLTNATSSVEITNGTSFTVTLGTADKDAVNLIVNKNLTSSTSGTTYNLAAAEDWAAGADSSVTVADASNGITASLVAIPTITSATYDVATGVLTVTGTGFLSKAGANNDIDVSKLSFRGEGSTGTTYTLTSGSVDVTSGTSFTITLNSADQDGVDFIADQNGTSSLSGTTYRLNALEDWAAGADGALTVADTTGNGVTVSNVAVPTITSATYNATTGVLAVTGTGILLHSGVLNDIDVSKLSIVGEGGGSGYTLTSGSVDATSIHGFSVTLNATDKAAVNQLLNSAGTSSTSGTTYNLVAAEDWNSGAVTATVIADLTGNGITVGSVPVPTITGATYDTSSGALVVTGTGFLSLAGSANDIDVSKLSLSGEDGQSRTLTSGNVEITSDTAFSVTLNAADRAAVNMFMNKTGTSSTGGTSYNLAAAEDWAKGAAAGVTDADLSGNGITATVAAPTITSATYDASTGVLTVTGTNLTTLTTGGSNDIDVTKLSITGDSSTYALTSGDVDITSNTSFTITLNGTDRTALATRLNKDGTSSTGNTTYNLIANEDWARGADAAVTIADTTGNGITVSNHPTLTSASYDAATGVLSLTGVYMTTGDTIDPSQLTLSGEGGGTYTLTTSSVTATSATSVLITLNATDRAAVGLILNKDGTSSTSGTTYNVAAAANWDSTGTAAADLNGNAVTVSNTPAPTLTSATYDASTGVLVVTGTGFNEKAGAANDIDVTKLTLTGEGGATYTLTANTANVEVTSGTSFSVTLGATDKAAVNLFMNKNGTSATDATAFNLAGASGWNAGSTLGAADPTGNAVTVSNVAVPAITSATYDATTGVLVVTGTGFLSRAGAANDIDISKLSILAEGATVTLSNTGNVEITSGTSFTVTLTAADKAALDLLTNQAGTRSTDGVKYNLAAAEDWARGADPAVATADLTLNDITVSNIARPTITSATYDATTGVLVVTGTNFITKAGAANDIEVTKLTLSGDSTAYTLTGDTANVEITSATSFTLTLGAVDKAALASRLNKAGTSSIGSITYNLAAAEDWMAGSTGANANLVDADLTGNGITAGGFNVSPSLGGAVASQAVNDNASLSPFSSFTITDPDVGATETISITLDAAAKGAFTSASLAASGFSTADGGLTYTHAADTPAALQAAIRQLVYQPGSNRLSPGSTESTTFTVNVDDGFGAVTDNTTTVVSTSVNDAPTLTTPTAASYTDTAALDTFGNSTGTLAGSDVDTGQTLTYGIAGGTVSGGVSTLAGSFGSLSVNTTSGAYTYTPSAGAINALTANTTDTFTVNVSDGTASTTATYTVSLTAANDTPTLATPTAVSYADTAALDTFGNSTGTLAGSDVDTGQTLAYGIAGGTVSGGVSTLVGTYGTLSVNTTSGAYTYTPSAGAINALTANTTDTFTVNVSDGTASTTATYTVNLTAANDTPTLATPTAVSYTDTAAADTFSNTTGTLAGSDADAGQTLTYGIAGGTVSGGISTLAGTYGTLSVNTTSGAYTYTPSAGAINALTANTTDTFTVNVSDGTASTTATYTVNLTAANDTPTLATPTAVSYADTAALDTFGNSTGTLAGSDVDTGQTLAYGIAGGTVSGGVSTLAGTYGTLSVNTTSGAYTYTPSAGAINALTANTTDTFTVNVSDGTASTTATYTVNLTAANDTPTLATPTAASYTDTAAADTFSNTTGTLVGHDVDAGQTLTYGIAGGTVSGGVSTLAGSFGSLSVNTTSGAYTYTPSAGAINALTANTTDTFTVSVSDGTASTTATYTVNLTAANDTPTLATPTAASYTDTAAADTFSNTTGTLAGSDADAGQTLTYGIAGGTVSGGVSTLAGSFGSLSVNTTSGAYTYTPSAGAINALTANTTDTFTVSVSDGTASTTATYTVNLTASNDTPTLATPTAASYTDTPAQDTFGNSTGTLAGSDVDAGQTLTYGIAGGTVSGGVSTLAGSFGSLSVNTTSGAYTYTPSANAINALTANATTTDTFTVSVSDGTAITTAVYTVTLRGADDIASLTPTIVQLDEGNAPLSTQGQLPFSDVDSARNFVPQTSTAGLYGSFSVDATGAWQYNATEHNEFAAGTVYIDTFQVANANGDGATTSVSIHIQGTNDAALIGGATTATIAKATGTQTGGMLTISDVDSPAEFVAQAVTAGQYGDFSLGRDGAWTYTLNKDTTRVLALKTGESLDDGFTVTSADGTTARVVVRIRGNDDIVIAPAPSPPAPEPVPAAAPAPAPSSFALPSAAQPAASITPVIVERAVVEKAAFASTSPANAAGVEARSNSNANVVASPPVVDDSAGSSHAAVGSGFPVAVSADPSAPLSVFKGVPDQTIPLQSSTISFSIPADAFTARPNAALSVDVRQTDGQALPTWLKFDPNTGKFDGTVPPNAPSELVIMVTVKDAQGGEATTTFRVKLVKVLQGRHGLSEQIRMAARSPHLFDRASVPRRAA